MEDVDGGDATAAGMDALPEAPPGMDGAEDRPSQPKRRSKGATTSAKTKAAASGDLGAEAKTEQRRRSTQKSTPGGSSGSGGLAKISEAVEWADESSRAPAATASLDDEFAELWAQAGTSAASDIGAAKLEGGLPPPPGDAGSEQSNAEGGADDAAKGGLPPVPSGVEGGTSLLPDTPLLPPPPANAGMDKAGAEEREADSEEHQDEVEEFSKSPSHSPAERAQNSPTVEHQELKEEEDSESDSDDSSEDEVAERAGRNAKDLELLDRLGGTTHGGVVSMATKPQERAASPPASRGVSKVSAGHRADAIEDDDSDDGDLDVEILDDDADDGAAAAGGAAPNASTASDVAWAKSVPREGPTRSRSPSPPAPVSTVGTATSARSRPAGGGGLLAMMDSAVASIEQAEYVRKAEEPEVAGLENMRKDAARAASGKASQPQGRIVGGRSDVFDQALRGGAPAAPGAGRQAAEVVPHGGGEGLAAIGKGSTGGLAGLRKAYDAGGGAGRTAGEGGGGRRPPEEPPEDEDDGASSASRPASEDGGRRAGAGAPQRAGAEGDPQEQDYEKMADEWEEIEARTHEIRIKEAADKGKIRAQDDIISTAISYNEVQQWLLQLSIDPEVLDQFRNEMVDDGGCGCFARRRAVSDVPGLDRKLGRDKDLVLFLKATHFDFNEVTHFRMLRTTYMKLTRNKVCPSIGRHWEVLGFQHTDPRTDLNRSGGLLNVLHLFFFFSHHFEILKSAYNLAQDVEQNFPLACVSINITKMVVETLLAGKLSKLCNSGDKGVLDTTCKVYAGCLFHFYSRWRNLKRTIRDTELTFNEVRKLLERRPAKLLEGLAKGIQEQKAKNDPSRFEFTELDFTSRAPQAAAQPAAQSGGSAASVPRRLLNYHDGSE